MKRRLSLFVLVAVLAALVLAGAEETEENPPEVKVSVSELMIGARLYDVSISPSFLGTTLYLRVDIPGRNLVKLNTAKSPLDVFEDNQGTEFLGDDEWGPPQTGWILNEDRESAHIPVSSGCVPKKGATRITAKGTFTITVAKNKFVATHEDVAIRFGTKLEAGPLRLRITKVGRSRRKPAGMEVGIDITGETLALLGIRFFDEAGDEVKCFLFEQSWDPGKGKVSWISKGFVLERWMPRGTIEVTYCTETEDVIIPFDVTVGLGLEEPAESDEKEKQTE